MYDAYVPLMMPIAFPAFFLLPNLFTFTQINISHFCFVWWNGFYAFMGMWIRKEEGMTCGGGKKQIQQHWCSKLFCPKTHQIKCNAYLIMCLCVYVVCICFGVCARITPSLIHHWNSSKSNWSTYTIKCIRSHQANIVCLLGKIFYPKDIIHETISYFIDTE